jgi:hypothetical protein
MEIKAKIRKTEQSPGKSRTMDTITPNDRACRSPEMNFTNVPPKIGELPLPTIYGGTGINQSQ